jgi:hypothetical protein
MKAHAEQTFKLTIELDHDEAELVREALGFASGELKRKPIGEDFKRAKVLYEQLADEMKRKPIGEDFKRAKVLYEQLADEMNERTWRE